MQVHVLRASVTTCTYYGIKYLKDAGNSFARDLRQDAKEDCEIGCVTLGGARSPGGRHGEGGHSPVLPVPSPCRQRGWGEGLGRGGCWAPGAGGTLVGQAHRPKSSKLPQLFMNKPSGPEGLGSDERLVPMTPCLLAGEPPLPLTSSLSATGVRCLCKDGWQFTGRDFFVQIFGVRVHQNEIFPDPLK